MVKIFITLLALKDADHVVRKTEYQLQFYSRKTPEEVSKALKILLAPDKRRPGQPHDGRRIEKTSEGWLVLNGEHYRKLMVAMNERARKRRWAATKRAQEREEKRAIKRLEDQGTH